MLLLTVPFAEKDQAKALGARWNAAKKKWYIPEGVGIAPFEKWLSADEKNNAGATPAPPAMEQIGLTVTGKDYFALEHDCIPWLQCVTCDALVKHRIAG
jgi:hypothetical protein